MGKTTQSLLNIIDLAGSERRDKVVTQFDDTPTLNL